MPPDRRRSHLPIKRWSEYHRAQWYLSRGYAPSVVARLVGVHRNTILKWSRRLELDAPDRERRSINAVLRRIWRFSPEGQRAIATALGRREELRSEDSRTASIERRDRRVVLAALREVRALQKPTKR